MTEVQRVTQNILDRFDQNADSTITWQEMKDALMAEGMDAATADAIRAQVFANWDVDKDAMISVSELKRMAETWAAFPGDQAK